MKVEVDVALQSTFPDTLGNGTRIPPIDLVSVAVPLHRWMLYSADDRARLPKRIAKAVARELTQLAQEAYDRGDVE